MTRTRRAALSSAPLPRASTSKRTDPATRLHLVLVLCLCLPPFLLYWTTGDASTRITGLLPLAAAFASKLPPSSLYPHARRRRPLSLSPSHPLHMNKDDRDTMPMASATTRGSTARRRVTASSSSRITAVRGGSSGQESDSALYSSSAGAGLDAAQESDSALYSSSAGAGLDAAASSHSHAAGGPAAASASAAASATTPTFVESLDGVRKQRVGWDAERRRFQVITHPTHGDNIKGRIERYLRQSFLPDHVTPDYYNYTRWRVLQRLISATVSVFGTRALLLALGLKTERVGLTATFNWIQKDAFGKFGRIMWASKMGRRFDSDAKRWRFRSSLLYAAGTGLEVLTYIFPAAFLLLATIANILKQMSMLTSSATRNAMYKSFAGDSQNLGDITAKGEAQIAVVDLLGILLGIFLSKSIGTAQVGMGVAYILLSCVDVFAIYNEIRSVVFSSLNLERGAMVVKAFVRKGREGVLNPNEASREERIFWNPASIDTSIFRTVSQTGCSLEELHKVREAFSSEGGKEGGKEAEKHFLVTWSPTVGASIVLHTNANQHDILRALLTWAYFEDAWKEGGQKGEGGQKEKKQKQRQAWSVEEEKEEGQRQERALVMLKAAHQRAKETEEGFLQALAKKGWDMRHTVFGKIKKRTEW